MKKVKMDKSEKEFMVELQALLNKYNARISATTRGIGEYEHN